ncbi:MAG: hypothetical protein H8E35_02015, partial [Ardenticatenia bacterium]|nr:hypothetical protein [Ardenticatenia bacterium]
MKAKRTIWGKRWLSASVSLILGLVAMLGFMLALSVSLGGETPITWAQGPVENLEPLQGPRVERPPQPWGRPVSPPRPEISQPEGSTPPRGGGRQPGFAPPHDWRVWPEDRWAAGGAPLFASAGEAPGVRSRGATALTPPLPGSADLAICMTSDRVWGIVGAGETATVIVDGTQMGAARADGNGFFWTTLYDANGDRPNLSGGETVVIYSEGAQEASVTLRSITGQVDSVSNVVSGAIGGIGHPMSVTVYAPADRPLVVAYTRTVSTDGGGAFTADFTGTLDFWGDGYAVVSYIENGVQVQREVYARELLVQPWPLNTVLGYADPGAAVTMTLHYSDTTVKQQMVGVAHSRRGQYRFNVPTDVLESDIVVVEIEGGDILSREVELLTLDVDAVNDRVTGQAPAGTRVSGRMSRLTAQGYPLVQTSTIASASGVYTLDFGSIVDIMPGNWAGVDVVDDEGDDLNLWAPSVSVEVNQTWNEVYGRGPSPPVDLSQDWPVTLTLYSAASGSESTYSKGMEWYGWYWFDENDGLPDIAPGDVVTVEAESYAWQGVVEVKAMTVQHDLDADRFTGSVETPTERVELSGSYWQNYLYPIGGSFDMLVTATSPFTGTPAGFDVNYNLGYEVAHRTADDYLERISRETGGFGVIMPANTVLANLVWPGVPFTITLYDSGGGFKAQLTGTSEEPIGFSGWQDFWGTGQQIETGDRVQVQSAAGFSQTLVIPDLIIAPDAASDVVYGQAPANALLYVEVENQGQGFVPTDGSGQFAVAVNQLQDTWGDGDLQWGNRVSMEYLDENRTWVWDEFQWPGIYARYEMEGGNTVFGHNAIPGNTIYITVTDELSQVVDSGTTYAGSGWDGPLSYALDFPDGTLAPSNTVTVDWGDGFVDYVHVVTITANPGVDTDMVTGTAPPEGWLNAWVQHRWGDRADINVQVDASGVYTLDFGAEGWDIQCGDSFSVYYQAPHGHQVEYFFWVPAPELSINKWNTSGHARPDGVVVYGISYQNNGNGTAENTLIVDTLPPNTTWAG